MVAGATHPHVLRRDGEEYRTYLQALAKDLGVESHVIFHNQFVSAEEMVELISAADIYITPYRHEEQVVSGTLAYALGAGKAIISTPYWHALELLDDRRGALVPFGNPIAIAEKTIELLDNDAARHAMRKRAYLYARNMVWERVAHRYGGSFERARAERMRKPRAVFSDTEPEKGFNRLPLLNLDHLHRLTDDTGILQHAIFTVPNYGEGYTTDDNARALVLAVHCGRLELLWAGLKSKGSGVPRVESSRTPLPQPLPSPAHVPGLSHCLGFRNISTAFPATGMLSS